jgi:hypothetical protein
MDELTASNSLPEAKVQHHSRFSQPMANGLDTFLMVISN